MSGNPYEKSAEEIWGTKAPTTPPDNPYLESAEALFGPPKARLQSALDIAAKGNPDATATAIKTARSIGVPTDVALRQPGAAAEAARRRSVNPEALIRQAPILSSWLENPQNAALAHDDIEALTGLESLVGRWRGLSPSFSGITPFSPLEIRPGLIEQAWQAGGAGRMLAEAQSTAGRMRVDPETLPGYANLEKEAQLPDVEDRNILTQGIVGLTGILPGMATGFARGGAYAAAAEGTATLAAGPTGAIAGLAGPVEAAFLLGIGMDTWDQEYGSAYAEGVKRQKEAGGVVDFNVAHRRAALAAFGNALVEVGGTKVLFAIAPALAAVARIGAKRTAAQAAKEALATPPGKIKAAVTAAWKAVIGTTEEAATEAIQRAETVQQVEAGVAETGGHPDFARTGPEAKAEFLAAFTSMFLLGGFGGAASFASSVHDIRQSKQARAKLVKLGQIIESSRLNSRLPEKTGEFAGELVKAGVAPDSLYTPIADYVVYWQSQGLDPEEIAKQLGVEQAYKDSMVTKADLAIPFYTYVEKVAGGKHHSGFSEYVKFDPDDKTPQQGDALLKELPQRSEAVANEIAETLDKAAASAELTASGAVADSVTEQLVATGMTETNARINASLPTTLFRTLEARTKQEPGTISTPYTIEIVRPGVEPVTVQAPRAPKSRPPPKMEGGKVIRAAPAAPAPMHGSDVSSPADVTSWVRSVGGISIKESSQIKPGSEDAKRIPFGLKAKKGGLPIETLAAQLVEAGHFEEVNAAQDWILEAITNPTGTEKPASMGEAMTDRQFERGGIKAAEEKRSKQAAKLSILLGDAANDALAKLDAGVEESVMSFDLSPGEVVYHKGEISVVKKNADGDEVLSSSRGDTTLGGFDSLDVIRLGKIDGDVSVLYQSAFHGSPYRFDKFDVGKIGTGEGAQVFGWGLYFSSLKAVGEYYRTALRKYHATWEGKPLDLNAESPEYEVMNMLGDWKRRGAKDPWKRVKENIQGQIPYASPQYEQFLYSELDVLDEWKTKGVVVEEGPGQLYQVKLPEDSDLLDWRKKIIDHPTELLQKLEDASLLPQGFVHTLGLYRELVSITEKPAKGRDQKGRDADTIRFDALRAEIAADPTFAEVADWDGQDLYESITVEDANSLDEVQKVASLLLRDAGIPGHIYEGNDSNAKNYVIYDDSAITVEGTFYQGKDDKQGYIKFTKGSKSFQIGLLENANLSTFLHETGHFFLEVMGDVAEGESAPQQIRDDYAAALKYLGVTNRDEITGAHHEKWARSFEAYLMEGKAPSVELAGVFERFRAWLISIYRKMGLGVQLTDEVRAVMDRLLATDEEIAKAEHEAAAAPMFLTMDDGAMTIAQWGRYRDTANRATEEARSDLQDQMLAEVTRARKDWWKEESAQVRENVTKQIDADPGHQANAFFRGGVMLSGEPIPEALKTEGGSPKKLDRNDVFNLFGRATKAKDVVRRLNFALTSINGVGPDTTAGLFGFETGSDMVNAMLAAGSRSKAIESEVSRIMVERHGDIMSDGSIAAAAQKAYHSSAGRLALYEMEHAALTRKAGGGQRLAPAAVMKKLAEQQVARMTVRDINAGVLLRAEAVANRAAREAERTGEWETARTETQRALYNHLLYRASLDTRAEMETIRKFVEKSNKDKVRARLAKAGANFLDNQDRLLEDFDFRAALTLKESDRRQSLRDWIAEQEAAGQIAEIPVSLVNESKRLSWQNRTVEEMRGLRDSLKNIQHLARLKNELLLKKGRAQLAASKARLIAAAESNLKDRGPLPISKNVIPLGERTMSRFAELDADLLKIETMIIWLDAEDIKGPWHELVWDPMVQAKYKELDMASALDKQMDLLIGALPTAIHKNLKQQIYVEGVGQVDRLWLVALALNTGNDGNYSRVQKGSKWSPGTIDRAVALLSSEELDYVQGIWNLLDTLRPEAAALYKRRTNLEFPAVEPREFAVTLADGSVKKMKGGYYPIRYDRDRSIVGEQAIAETISQLYDDNYTRAVTARGYSKDRAENFARPVDFTLNAIPGHIAQVIHDIAFGEAIDSVGKILLDPEIRATMQRRLGKERSAAFLPWLKGAANYQAYTVADLTGAYTKWIERRRSATTAAVLAAKITIMTGNFANIPVAMARIRPDYLTKAVVRSMRHPMESWRQAAALSGEVRHRMTTFDRDMKEGLASVRGQRNLRAQALRFGYAMTGFTDLVTAVPIFWGSYEQSRAHGMEHEDAVRAADATVRNIVSTGHPIDLPRAMRTRGPERLMTMFYGYASAQYQLLRSSLNQIEKARLDRAVGQRLPIIIAQATAVVAGNAIIGEMLSSRGPEDDENWAVWALRSMLLFPGTLVPGLRDLVRFYEGAASGNRGFYSASPILGTAEKVARAGWDVFYELPFGDGEKDVFDIGPDLISAGAFYYGVPGAGQIATSGHYFWDLFNDETPYVDFPTFVEDSLYPRPKERR